MDLPQEETRLTLVLSGDYRSTQWMQPKIEASFFHLKGAIEALFSLLDWQLQIQENHTNRLFHPYQCADIVLHGKVVGTMGALHRKLKRSGIFLDVFFLQTCRLIIYYNLRIHKLP